MTAPAVIEELRLTKFKSFYDAVLPLRDLTLLIGRNGSGKSNVLDALEVLSKLALGEDTRDSIDGGRREGAAVRGGVEGCAPFGEHEFSIGCSVRTAGELVSLDVTVQVEPDVQVTYERLCRGEGNQERDLLVSDPPDPQRGDLSARYYNGKQGPNPALPFRSSRLLTSQVATKIASTTKALREVHRAADQVLEALESVFILDPVPHLMRQYVQARDFPLRRQADNLTAAIDHLRADQGAWDQLIELTASLPEQEIADVTVERSPLGDVMLAVTECLGGEKHSLSARLMSDGMLRFLAFATALLEAPRVEDAAPPDGVGGTPGQTTLVIEEVENGLHPSQAARVIALVKAESERRLVRTLATTHSPALLTALDGDDHEGVMICERDPHSGWSRIRRLVDLPGYARAMAAGSLGDAVTQLRLDGERDDAASGRAIEALLQSL
jgi:predicted ATPase